LLQKGARLDATDKRGWNCLIYAIHHQNTKLALKLLKHPQMTASIASQRKKRTGQSPLIMAVQQ
jgi:ankyrin repeat protein